MEMGSEGDYVTAWMNELERLCEKREDKERLWLRWVGNVHINTTEDGTEKTKANVIRALGRENERQRVQSAVIQ